MFYRKQIIDVTHNALPRNFTIPETILGVQLSDIPNHSYSLLRVVNDEMSETFGVNICLDRDYFCDLGILIHVGQGHLRLAHTTVVIVIELIKVILDNALLASFVQIRAVIIKRVKVLRHT